LQRLSLAVLLRRSADVIDPSLVCGFLRCLRLRRKLQHCSLLAFAQQRQQNRTAVGKFQRVVVGSYFILIDLPENCGGVIQGAFAPRKRSTMAFGFAAPVEFAIKSEMLLT